MIDRTQKQVLILALYAGEIMMKSGAEVYRVEDTIVRICKACKISYVECFVTTTGIFISLDSGDADSDMYTFIKRIHTSEIDLQKISKVNNFSREFTTTDLSIEKGQSILKEIDKMEPYPFWIRLLGTMLVSFFACLMFKGSALAASFAAVIGIGAYCLSHLIMKVQFNSFLNTALCCAFCAFMSILCVNFGLIPYYGPIIIGTIIIFLPGVAITNAARDLLSGDMLAGTARAVDAFITAISIAGGVGVVLKLADLWGGGLL